ncbi:MAG: DUF4230 domain-containing protein [Spirochaetales bacterium]|nr:DUF4230 domain-containing protein [Spirochaetales bacterium]
MSRVLVAFALAYFIFVSCSPAPPVQTADGLRRILQLATAEMLCHEVVYRHDESRWFFLTYGVRETLFSIDLKVQAGFDLSGGWRLVPDPEHQTLRVFLPPPRVLLIDAVDTSIREYFSAGEPLGYLRLRALLKDRTRELEKKAVEQGILDQAQAKAQIFVEGFFKNLGWSRVQVEFKT